MNAAYIRSLQWVDWVYHTLTDPRALARRIAAYDKGFLPAALLFPALSALFFIVASSVFSPQNVFFAAKVSYGWILAAVANTCWVLLLSLLLDMGAQFSHKAGNIKGLLTLVSLAQIPGLFLLPAVSIFAVLGFAPLLFFMLFSIFLSLWSAFIVVTGVSEMYALPFGRAVALYLIPCAALCAAVLIVSVSGGVLFAEKILSL